MPVVIERYVRTGKLRMELRMLAFLGPDSAKAARVIQAAAAQDRLWNVLDLAYWNQGRENSGYVTEAWLRAVLGAVPGLDGARVLRDAAGRPVREALARAERDARRWQVAGTPAFLLGATGGTPRKVGEQALSADALGTEIDALLGDDAR
jgi:protein-disulfide isomerase